MGALHAGHISLVKLARRRADRVVVSVFVNPAQFAPHEDFARYPRTWKEDLAKLPWEREHVVISFHGLPLAYVDRGDPYPDDVARTTRGLVERLGLPPGQWTQTYQSRFGRGEWLKPYTDDVLVELAKRGVSVLRSLSDLLKSKNLDAPTR